MPFYNINRPLLVFFLFVQALLLHAQNYPSRNYTASKELPNNAVRALFVDSSNILWIGTENGVVSKQNDVFKSYFEEDGLALNSCWAITEDSKQRIWFGSYGGGISIFDGNEFKVLTTRDGLVNNEIIHLYLFKDHIYAGTSNGISRINIHDFHIESWNIENNPELLRVSQFFEFEKHLYVNTYRTGIYKISTQEDLAITKVHDRKFIYASFTSNDSIYSSNKGFYTKTSIATYLNPTPSKVPQLGQSIFWDYVKTKDSAVYAAAWGIYDRSGGIYKLDQGITNNNNTFDIDSEQTFSLAYHAEFDRLYVGTLDAGLYEIQLNPLVKFELQDGLDILGFASLETTKAKLTTQGVFLETSDGPVKIDLEQFKNWQEHYVRTTSLPLPEHKDLFYELDFETPARKIRFYDIKTSGDLFWINSSIGIFSIDVQGSLRDYFPLHSEEINFTMDGDLIETHPYGGARVYEDSKQLAYTYYPQDQANTPTLVVSSLKTDDRTYFTSVFSGLYAYENGAFKSYITSGRWKEKNLRHIIEFKDKLAVSTEFGDVYILKDHPDSLEIIHKIPRAQIQGNTISFLRAYKHTLLIGTERGVTLIEEDRFIHIDEEQGLKQPLLSARVENNELLIGSKNGIFTLGIDDILRKTPRVKSVQLENIYVNNKAYERFDDQDIILDYDQNTVHIGFSTNAHPYPKKLKYQYRLGKDEAWSTATNAEILLPFLPSSKYQVQVRVFDASTGLAYTQDVLDFTIKPPFWKTWWFISLMILLLVAIMFSIYSYEIAKNKKFEDQKRAIQKRFEETKMEALLAQMNPHFIFNAMNSIQSYIMESDIDNASMFLGDFAKLIRLNLDHCTKPTILLVEEIDYLQAYIRVENTRMNHTVDLHIDIDPEIDTYDVEIPTMILQTFVENVFVHAFSTEVKEPRLDLVFKIIHPDTLLCQVKDNGSGFSTTSTNSLHESKGLKLVKERLALLGYNIEALSIHSTPGKGTEVNLYLRLYDNTSNPYDN